MTNREMSDLSIAIRMTCSNPDVTSRKRQPACIVTFDGSEQACQLAGDAQRLDDRARELGLGAVTVLSKDGSAAACAQRLAADIAERKGTPCLVSVEGLGVFCVGRSGRDVHLIHTACVKGHKVEAPPAQGTTPRRLDGCVTMVTGGAQGFGMGIAEELADQGACVVIADIKDEAGKEVVRALNDRFGPGTAAYGHMNVTDMVSIEEGLACAVAAFGGIDLFVSNAGVLRAGSLEEMDENSFDLVTAVNYKAYFLGVKAVAPLMKRQHEFDPGHVMDIVQVNSKSGLQGSNKNFAYAGSKFGCIGLTQSFALELVPFNIKVNSVCPGNYYDGPLWSDPDSGLFVQYLRAEKVPGAKTVQDVRDFYQSKSPIRRGCTPGDVAKAIVYLHEQEYETGQALPVTGGQAMLR